MPARAFVIRFPNGDFEYDFTRRLLPRTGDRLKRRGTLWRVTSSAQDGGEGIVVVRVSSLVHAGTSASMTELRDETERGTEDHPHPLESEDALRESAEEDDNEEERDRAPQPGVTPDRDDR